MALPVDVLAESQGIRLFNKWSYDDVEVKDISLTDYIQIRNPVYLPHTAGRFSTKRFRKAQVIVNQFCLIGLFYFIFDLIN